ncbi:MAG: hypothetical protein AAGB48_07525 [Planctomycetota bacterium]
MFKPLRHPTAFLALTLCLFGWLSAWSYVPARPADFYWLVASHGHSNYRPLFIAANYLAGHPGGRFRTPVSDVWHLDRHPTSYRAVIQTDTETYALIVDTTSGKSVLPDNAVAGARVINRLRSESFGILAPVFNRFHADFHLSVLPENSSLPLPDEQQAIEAAAEAGYWRPARVDTKVDWFAAFHDLVFMVTCIAWARSAFAVPGWPVWKRITPKQRRRMQGRCLDCGYNRAAAPDAPCPECGDPQNA